MLCCLLMQVATACSPDSNVGEVFPAEGTLCLRLSADRDYVSVETRAEQTLTNFSDFTFTLDGVGAFTPSENGTYILPAGTYKLTASNKAAACTGTGKPYYENATTFTLAAGETKEVPLNLGTPKNTKLVIALSSTFASNYENLSLTLTDSEGRAVTVGKDCELYLQPGQASYTLTADAKLGSHLQDASTNGTLTLEAGTSQTIHIEMQPITGLVLIETGDSYGGEFE